ncbi:hypothetical protein RHMOL_Rhmol06G0306000 [Rhododendron molle]|uniref:Uncharacterized protein n=1 Tax=Rhododendron molle TaxID=49168 RepID=A0ACC0NJZ4_RHOML|nr:hypothetical protein RHMOL_Rhmol06G0306000 [Rhododendron molle]
MNEDISCLARELDKQDRMAGIYSLASPAVAQESMNVELILKVLRAIKTNMGGRMTQNNRGGGATTLQLGRSPTTVQHWRRPTSVQHRRRPATLQHGSSDLHLWKQISMDEIGLATVAVFFADGVAPGTDIRFRPQM